MTSAPSSSRAAEAPRTLAALYDIHGNLPALEAVLADLAAFEPSVDLLVIGGDVFPGPLAEECLDRLLHLDVDIPLVFLRGNGEREVLAAHDGRSSALPSSVQEQLAFHAAQLSAEQRRFLGTWPLRRTVELGGGDTRPQRETVLFCHATPRSDSELFTERSPGDDFHAAFLQSDHRLVVCGHTHMPFDRTVEELRVINAGSVGMPFGHTGADWLLLDGQGAQLCHTDYDLQAAAQRLRSASWPGADDFVDRSLLAPPSAESMIELFEGSRTAQSQDP